MAKGAKKVDATTGFTPAQQKTLDEIKSAVTTLFQTRETDATHVAKLEQDAAAAKISGDTGKGPDPLTWALIAAGAFLVWKFFIK